MITKFVKAKMRKSLDDEAKANIKKCRKKEKNNMA